MKTAIAILAMVLMACGVEPATGSAQQAQMCTNCDQDGEIDPATVPEASVPVTQQTTDLRGCVRSGTIVTCCGSLNEQTDAGVCCRSVNGTFAVCWATSNIVWELNNS